MEKLKMHSPNLVENNIAKLSELFPNRITESADDKGNIKNPDRKMRAVMQLNEKDRQIPLEDLDSSLNPQPSQAQVTLFANNIKDDRSPEDLLFQVLLDWGVDLSLPINVEMIDGKEVLFVDNNILAACFDKNGGITEDFVKELVKREPLRVVFRDAGLKATT